MESLSRSIGPLRLSWCGGGLGLAEAKQSQIRKDLEEENWQRKTRMKRSSGCKCSRSQGEPFPRIISSVEHESPLQSAFGDRQSDRV